MSLASLTVLQARPFLAAFRPPLGVRVSPTRAEKQLGAWTAPSSPTFLLEAPAALPTPTTSLGQCVSASAAGCKTCLSSWLLKRQCRRVLHPSAGHVQCGCPGVPVLRWAACSQREAALLPSHGMLPRPES